MNRRVISLVIISIAVSMVYGCSGNSGNPVMPNADQTLTVESNPTGMSQTHLWGYYNLLFDFESNNVEVMVNRSTMFTANIVKFLNASPAGLQVSFNGSIHGAGYVDVDLDVTINHPLDNEKFDGYDVRGLFIGDGSGMMQYNGDLVYPVNGVDQILLNADGYSRWFNPSEFMTPGIFGYTQGNLAPSAYTGTATLNPYKYFGNGLGATDDLWSYLTSGDPQAGYFLHGTGNTRNYVIRFPVPVPGIKYGYAVVASWGGGLPQFHPAHAPEAVGCEVVDNSNVYYTDPVDNGGNLILNISLFGWNFQPSTINVESTVLSSVAIFDSEMVAIGGGEHYSTYHIEIPADNVTSTGGNEFWIIAEYSAFDYSNEFGVPNTAFDPLAACFRFDLPVLDEFPVSYTGWAETWGGTGDDEAEGVAVDHSGNVYVTGYFSDTVDLDPGDGTDIHTSKGIRDVYLSKFNNSGEFEWARSWGGIAWEEGRWVNVDGSGNIYVAGTFSWIVDFDPGPGTDTHVCIGGFDAFVSKFDPSGNYQWALTWGGDDWDEARGVSIDDSMNIYVAGLFIGTADFDPGDGIDTHNSNGDLDAYLSKFDSGGNFQWARTWGSANTDRAYALGVDNSGNAYVAGFYSLTVDFDPGPGSVEYSSNGVTDIFLTKFDTSGIFQWARTWGGIDLDEAYGITTDGSGNSLVTGMFKDSVDFYPGTETDIHVSNGDKDVFLSMFDSSGDFQWVRTWGGVNADVGHSAALDSLGNVYVAGEFMNEADFDPGVDEDFHTSNGSTDIFLTKFNFIGGYLYAITLGGTGGDLGFANTVDDWGNSFVAGYYLDDVNFAPVDPPCNEDPDVHSSIGVFDAFVAKYLQDGCW